MCTASGQAPLLRGRGGFSITREMRQGAAEMRPDMGPTPEVWVLVIPFSNRRASQLLPPHLFREILVGIVEGFL